MKLRTIEIDLTPEPLPDAAVGLIKEASDRVDVFMEAHKDSPVAGFVPSDFTLAYAALLHVRRTMLASGDAFCEWGSGIGAVTCLAGMLGYDAIGIEFDPDLVDVAEGLADDFDISAQFVCGSFVPTGGEHFTDVPQEAAWLMSGGLDAYEQLGLDADDFDVIYAYPWPGEEQVIFDLFKRYAAVGALLVTYHGIDDIRVQRKVSSHK
jgi:hypothetical protein